MTTDKIIEYLDATATVRLAISELNRNIKALSRYGVIDFDPLNWSRKQKRYYLAYRFEHCDPHWCVCRTGKTIVLGCLGYTTDRYGLNGVILSHQKELEIIKKFEFNQR